MMKNLFTLDNLFKLINAIIILGIIFFVYKIILRAIKKIPPQKITPQRTLILNKIAKYTFFIAFGIYILNLFGVKLSAIWGAAGIAGIAIGFAAQTTISNLISGLFVVTEGALKIGDTIIVNEITGIVDSINLISVRIHTLDNQMVRIPNSTIMNTNLTNNTYHLERRMTISVSINYESDMQKALETLQKAPLLCPTVLPTPEPTVWFNGFESSSINMTIAVWYKTQDFLQTKNDLYISIKKVLDEANIEIPYNKLDVKVLENN